MNLLDTRIGRLRMLGMIEAVSFLLLLGVAMPLKYVWQMPVYVKVVGWAHGMLFVSFCCALLFAMLHHKWSIPKAAKFFIAALLPFGPFIVDKSLKQEDEAASA
jgi:integral membrane protein